MLSFENILYMGAKSGDPETHEQMKQLKPLVLICRSTPILKLAREGHTDAVMFLLSLGTNPHDFIISVIQVAAESWHDRLTLLLLDHIANTTPYLMRYVGIYNDALCTAVEASARRGCRELTGKLLLERGADIDFAIAGAKKGGRRDFEADLLRYKADNPPSGLTQSISAMTQFFGAFFTKKRDAPVVNPSQAGVARSNNRKATRGAPGI